MRIAIFVLAHVLFLGVAVAIAAAQGASPYDTRFETRHDAAVMAGPEEGSAVTGQIADGTEGIVLRWCRPEFPFHEWAFGGRDMHRRLLDERVCEVSVNGQVAGFVRGSDLAPE
ncbi:MAG: hypothetical protein KDI98_03405 [Hyphomicrobiaceae bacterium]|nr:hypothetical protein [Hyphomicrobiaceae bacterium]